MQAAIFHRGQVVASEDLYDATGRCPVCHFGGPRPRVATVCKAPTVVLLECNSCRACSASMMPSEEILARLYSEYYATCREQVAFDDIRRLARHILKLLGTVPIGRRVRILDFGGGDGSLARHLGRSLLRSGCGYVDIVLVDYHEIEETAETDFRIGRVTSLEQTSGLFDVVIASAIMEHIPEVNAVFKGLFARVAPGGHFYARTPYMLPFIKIFKNMDFTYPFHVHDMGDKFWNGIVRLFDLPATLIASQPSIVETTLARHPFRTVIAHAFKLSARVEQFVNGSVGQDLVWSWVGGWEVMIRFRHDQPAVHSAPGSEEAQ